jgi:hypothetical protein
VEWADEKNRLYQSLVSKGIERKEIRAGDSIAPPELLLKWVRNFYAPVDDVHLSDTPRLLNRFSIGADPELVFQDPYKRYVHAETFGMDTLAAFGCDMSGRQAELRAMPSRSALDVVASLMEALRWMATIYPMNEVKWVATPYIADADGHRDGCGGHVHLGRKRPDIRREVEQLNHVNSLLRIANVFDREGDDLRIRNTKYGIANDFRLQRYGYEYRTFSTWISSPWIAYLSLVVAKLAVLHRTALKPEGDKAHQQIKNLLCLYKGLDDDALIAWKAMQVLGMPKWVTGDIRVSWGVSEAPPLYGPESVYVPASIAPERQTRQELFNLFTKGVPIPRRVPNPTWTPFMLPVGFYKVTVQPHVFNIPDIAMGLVSKGVQVTIVHGSRLIFDTSLSLPKAAIQKRLSSVQIAFEQNSSSGRMNIIVPKGFAEVKAQIQALKAVLCDSTLFPICRVEDINTAKWGDFTKREVAEKKVELLGRKLSTVYGQRGM